MNLTKLFETQQLLRDKIGYEGQDRLEKLILALLVEVGECANEWRGFKFWSKNQEPRTSMNTCEHCNRLGRKGCIGCYGKLYKNPLLEEYVDGLHFVLELCIELQLDVDKIEKYIEDLKKVIGTMEYQFGYIYHHTSSLMNTVDVKNRVIMMLHIFKAYLGLGYRLGFSWEQIEQAYFDKNKVNHERQENGY
ncbi:dUTP diphosphatase [Bacillus sp. Au-Bac7]|uniref:dUTP diphosphatase n=1 Tax=Bacillus sp. Au-Bac7 TaxID=2906458 RepID=UPI001E2C4FB2|nr:dUTP diphosphatase [Bacillus sp. Au-Bac7]MCE4052005.1 dUTP diphosphatase [Bacillus sp. Au-Bac7]